MGHTLPTATMLIREFEDEIAPFARALRREDRELLGDLLAMVYYQSAPIAYHAPIEPIHDFTLAMCLGILKRVAALERAHERAHAHSDAERRDAAHPDIDATDEPADRAGFEKRLNNQKPNE